MYIEATENGKVSKGKVSVIRVSIRGGISFGLALGVSVTVILLIVLIFNNIVYILEKKIPYLYSN